MTPEATTTKTPIPNKIFVIDELFVIVSENELARDKAVRLEVVFQIVIPRTESCWRLRRLISEWGK